MIRIFALRLLSLMTVDTSLWFEEIQVKQKVMAKRDF